MWEYVPEEMDDAQAQVSEMEKMLDGAGGGPGGGQSQSLGQFRKIMDDDLDTPAALRLAMDLAREGRTGESARILDILGFRF
jgi:cysteinyl-tRNA synthetase